MDTIFALKPATSVSVFGTMKAARIHRYGPPDVIAIEEIERPAPGEGEVLVRVEAAGVGPWDAWIRTGKSAIPQPLPLTLGSDLSGIVEAVGPGVTSFAPGEAVFGVTNARFVGAQAEYAVVSADIIAERPASLTDAEAASVPVIAVTAWQALFEQARTGPGDTVLIHGAAGSVGAFAVQFAKSAGARVIATAGPADIPYVQALGADTVIDYRAQRFEDLAQGVDTVIDLVGGETQSRSFAALRPGGILVSAVSQPDAALAARHGVKAVFFLVEVTTMHLTRIAEMLDAGEIRTNVGMILPLGDIRLAHEMLDGSRARPRGKIVLEVGK